MIGYVNLGTNDLQKAKSFYDQVLAKLGANKMIETPRMIMYVFGHGNTMLAINTPYDKEEARAGNGNMVALLAPNKKTVDEIHDLALSLGAKDEGAPGPRQFPGFYGAYFRDFDGNKVAAYIIEQ